MKRMILTKLILTGQGKKDAVLTFYEGLNVISGDSDTGKTYAFQCLNYMLGAEKPPKEIQESIGYTNLSLEFKVEDAVYELHRAIGSNIVTAIHNGESKILSYKHDPNSTSNLSRYLLSLLSESEENSFVFAGNKKGKRTVSFRDIVHICALSETDIIAESSAFQSIQYTERTVRTSILKFIITGQDDSDYKPHRNIEEEKLRRAGVIQFLEIKKREILEKISRIENDPAFKLYVNDPSLNASIGEIQSLRKEISELNAEISKNTIRIATLNEECFKDEAKILEFKKLEMHYVEELKKITMLSTYEDFVSQLPQVACPFCNQPINVEIITEENQIELFNYWQNVQQDLQKKKDELSLAIIAIDGRLNTNRIEIANIQARNNHLIQKATEKKAKLDLLSENIAKMREFDEMQSTLKILNSELLSISASIEEYSKKIVKEKEITTPIDNTKIDKYCSIVEAILKSWGFDDNTKVTFNTDSLDLIIDGKERILWGKGYRAFIMSAMTIGLMRYCFEYHRLHPGFVIIDSPLVSLKERKKESSTTKWIETYMEKKMVEDILRQDAKRQVIIFENKDIKFDFDYNYIEYNHSDEGPNGFIPKT